MSTIAYFGHHKCASTYIIKVMQSIAQLLGLTIHKEYLSTHLPFGYEKVPAQATRVAAANRQLVTKPYDLLCHGNADQAVVAAVTQRGPFRGFHVIRDPRDLVVSGYFWHQADRDPADNRINPWNAERRNRLRAAANQEEGLLLEIEFAACYCAAMSEWDYLQPTICETQYEAMIVDPLAFFTTALTFLGLPVVDHVGTAVWGIKLNQLAFRLFHRPLMRLQTLPKPTLKVILARLAFERSSGGRPTGTAAPGQKYRKGIAGDWRNYFTPRVAAAFQERYGALLLARGYETDSNWHRQIKA